MVKDTKEITIEVDSNVKNESISNTSIEMYNEKEGKYIFTGEELLNLNIGKLECLIEPIFPKTGVVALAGSSDTGKSSFLRQLGCAIVTGEKDFLGFKINTKHKNVIYVSTEDDKYAIAYLLNKQNDKKMKPEEYKNFRVIFDTDDIISRLEASLKKQPADCIILDTFTDLYDGELNASNKVRGFINKYRQLAIKYNCLIIFLHHTGKRTENLPPSKDNVLGSQGFEGKMRLVLELRKDIKNTENRHLCIVKGNYIETNDKEKSYLLKFNENMKFSNLNTRVPYSELMRSDAFNSKVKKRSVNKEKAIKYKNEGLTIRQIEEKMKEEGINVSKSSVANWIKDCPNVQSP